jgi:hypothetical protein
LRRVRVLLALLGTLAGLFVTVSHATTDEGILLRGSRTAYVDLYVYSSATITPADVSMKGGRSFVGFFMSPAPADRDTVGALVMPRVGATPDQPMKLGASWDVRPGKYRVFLLTDGPAEVFVPIAGQGLRAHKPTGRAPLGLTRADFDVPAGATVASHAYPADLRSRSLVVTVGQASSKSLTAIDQMDACVSTDTACAVSTEAPTLRLPNGRAWTYGVTLAPPGRWSGVLDVRRALGDDAPSHVDGAVLVLTIGIQT